MYNHSAKVSEAINLDEYLLDRLKEVYKEECIKNDGNNFLQSSELTEVYMDGVKILEWFLKHRNKFFPKRG